ncbi:MAG: nucleoside permease [Bacteroidota bacterium]|nr:nucleoside permease [Bacteroidota bacterium]
MGLKFRLIIMNFLQFFIWGSWLITIGAYWFQTQQWSGAEFGAIFSTMGIASLFMPAIAGIIADKWINTEKLLGIFHLGGAIALFALPFANSPGAMFWIMLINMIFYMPTIALSISVSYSALKEDGQDVEKAYPPIRVWGTVGFIIAMWTINLGGIAASSAQFFVASGASLVLAIYSFTLPKCPPNKTDEKKSLVDILGLNAFKLFKDKKMAIFFVFSMLLGAALQLTNAYGDTFLHEFKKIPIFANAFAVTYSEFIMSISQISETLFILAIPFFLKRFGIKKVMLMSMFAWVLRFALLGLGDPMGGLWMIVLSGIVYGMAFDFFNISGSLFVEREANPKFRASAQGLFMMMTNGFGAIMGSLLSGIMIDKFFVTHEVMSTSFIKGFGEKFGNKIVGFITDPHFTAVTNAFQWRGIWLTFALYSLIVAFAFMIIFKYKHDPTKITKIKH